VTGPLDGRTILVTGAGGGLGRGIAVACATRGAHVVIASPGPNGEQTARLVRDRGGSAQWIRCDVTVRADIDAAVACTDRLDVCVHNATSRRSSQPNLIEDLNADVWADHASVTLRGSYYCAQAALPKLRAAHGTLILMTSPAGMEGSRMLPAYAMVKGALRGFAKSLAREWGPLGVRVNLVSPLARTPAMEQAIRADPPLADRLAKRVPLGRLGDAETDIGAAVAFLASDDARYVTGQTLVVDGGRFTGL
jgi:NAD(P)-dependent dehydrogenase (short-subunit alcohol dehydrogenase family)